MRRFVIVNDPLRSAQPSLISIHQLIYSLTQEMILGLYFPSGLSVKQVTQHIRTLEQLRKRKAAQIRLSPTLYGQYFYPQFPNTEYLINIRAVHS
jgi:hypothetical protein